MSPAARLLGTALGVALVAGCGAAGASGAAPSPEREWQVAEDPDATTEEIIDAGGPVDVAVSADGGHRVVTWRVEPEDDEGSSWGAWRLQDADGDRVADGHFAQVTEQGAVIDAVAVPDGFVLLDYATGRWRHLDLEGALSPVGARDEPGPVQQGDVLLDPYAAGVYRPADRATYPLPPGPTADPQGTAVDPTGTVHVLLPRRLPGAAVVASSPGGSGPWTRSRAALPAGAAPGLLTTASDGSLLLPTVLPDQDFGHVGTVDRRPVGGSWNSVTVPQDLGLAEPQVDVLDDRLVLSESGATYLQDADGGFTELDPPGEGQRVDVAGGALWAYGSADHEVWVSDDLGASWERVPR